MSTMKKQSLPESVTGKPSQLAAECWFDDACILDMDYFVKTLSVIKAKGVSPDLIGSLITHYASKWLPELTGGVNNFRGSTESITALWMKKRFLVETLMGILPPENDSIPCNFLLRLLRTANTVGVERPHRAELEKRISWQLDEASLKELMIPSFSHTCGTLLDVELVYRLVQRFVSIGEAAQRSGAAMVKVAKLVDSYLAEAAVDSNLTLPEFVNLGSALPSHARALDDGLYRAVDTYLKAHPGVTKDERKTLCRLIDSAKLSPEASLHATQNVRLPLRAVIQVLLQANNAVAGGVLDHDHYSPCCHSKRQVTDQHLEIEKLREDVIRLQSQVSTLQLQMERLMVEKKTKKGFLSWTKFGYAKSTNVSVVQEPEIVASGEVSFGRCLTPMDAKTKVIVKGKTPPKWRTSSMS